MNVGTIPSPNVINDHNPAFGPPIPKPPPPVVEPQNGKTVNEILSETIQRLRRELIESNVKNAKLEEKNKKVTEEIERLRVLLQTAGCKKQGHCYSKLRKILILRSATQAHRT